MVRDHFMPRANTFVGRCTSFRTLIVEVDHILGRGRQMSASILISFRSPILAFLAGMLAAGCIAVPARGEQKPGEIHIVPIATARVGIGSALDGHTSLLDGTAIRLWGIQAAELAAWPWGPRARRQLDDLLAAHPWILCEPRGHLQNLIAAQCWLMDSEVQASGADYHLTDAARDIGALLISTGYAVEYRSFTGSHFPYQEREKIARSRKLGVWRE